MIRKPLTPTKATLLMLGVGTIALMGVPGFGHYDPPEGPITGIVLDPAGRERAGAEVALFDETRLSLVALTRTDLHGRFAFHAAPARFAVFGRDPAAEHLVGDWVLARERGPWNELELVLGAGRPVRIQVADVEGNPVEAAEVRVFDPDGAACVARLAADAEGLVSFHAPARTHLAILDPDGRWTPVWLTDQEIPEGGRSYEISLLPGVEVGGKVQGPRGEPLEGIVVTCREDPDDAWIGYAVSNIDGFFRLRTRSGSVHLRASDPLHRFLPVAVRSDPERRATRSLSLVLAAGNPLEVRVRSAAEGVPARVWVWSDETETWSWGTRSDSGGVLRTSVSGIHGVAVDPESERLEPLEAWPLPYEEPLRTIPLTGTER